MEQSVQVDAVQVFTVGTAVQMATTVQLHKLIAHKIQLKVLKKSNESSN